MAIEFFKFVIAFHFLRVWMAMDQQRQDKTFIKQGFVGVELCNLCIFKLVDRNQ